MKWIEKCLNSLMKSSLSTSIVVVDNCSYDETISFIRKTFPTVHIIENKENKGFGQANNQGIEYAFKNGATHFFLCNQDLYVKIDTLSKLIEVQDKYLLSVVSPLQMNGSFQFVDQSFYNVFIRNNLLFVSNIINGNLKDYYESKYFPAAAWIISRECIETIGGFDPLFFHYGEDANYLNRVLYHKKLIGVVPTAFVGHDRVFKGNVNAFNKYSHLAILLYLYSDPSNSLFTINKQRVKAHLVFIRDIVKLFLTLRVKNGLDLLLSYFSFWVSLGKINNSIKTNRALGHNWLNL
jgi:GT2 family glycosyltransferase